MLLCDIGNTSYHFYNDDTQEDYKEYVSGFDPQSLKEKVYYICVNPEVKKLLKNLQNWIDIAPFVNMQNYYETMGIDRIIACEAVEEGVIIDAGSAITVDVVKNGVFQGGFIYPGIEAMSRAYATISPKLHYPFNFFLDLNNLAKNSQDAISYGYLKTLYSEVISYEMPIVLTGGDAKRFMSIFPEATVNEMLLFEGMKKILSLIKD